jgi:hypothetical protein
LPGQAGGIVALIFDLVTLSQLAPACPAKLTRPRALRSSVTSNNYKNEISEILQFLF